MSYLLKADLPDPPEVNLLQSGPPLSRILPLFPPLALPHSLFSFLFSFGIPVSKSEVPPCRSISFATGPLVSAATPALRHVNVLRLPEGAAGSKGTPGQAS